MVASRFETQPIGEMLPPPTTSHSALLSAEKPFYEVAGFAADVVPQLSSQQSRKQIADKIDVINQTMSDPRLTFGQRSLNTVSEIGSAIGATIPLAYAGAEIGAGAAGIAGAGMEVALPEAALNFARTPISKLATGALSDYLPSLTTAELAKGVASGYGAYKGMVLPEHVVENYHKDTDTLDSRTAIKDWSHDNLGFLLPVVPLAGGYLAYKVFSVGREAKRAAQLAKSMIAEHELKTRARQTQIQYAQSRAQQAAYQAAEEVRRDTGLEKAFNEALDKGTITPAEHEWYKNYLANPDDIDAHSQGAMRILQDAQLPIDRATGRVWFELLGSNDVKQLKQAITDQVSSGFSKEEQTLLSDYISHNRMDVIRTNLGENPNMLKALKGYTDFVDKKLGAKDKALSDLDTILQDHGAKGLKKNEMFSQNRIYKHLKQKGVVDPQEVPYTVPDNVAYKLRLAQQLDNVMRQRSPRYRQWFQEGMHEKIKEKMKDVKILTPEEELEHLRKKLITPKGLIKNFQNNRAYHRLQELGDVWANARHLLDRVHLEHEYGKQAAFNNVLKSFTDLVDSSAQRLANPLNVTNYLKRRIEQASPKIKEFVPPKPVKVKVEEGKVGEETAPKVLQEERKSAEETKAKSAKDEFLHEDDRYKQFADNQDTLQRMVECAWRQLNG